MEQVRDFEIQLPPWYKRIELIHTQIASAAVFGSCLIIQIFNFYLSMLIFASDTGNYFGTGLCLISVFTGILSLLGLILSRIFHSFDSKKRL